MQKATEQNIVYAIDFMLNAKPLGILEGQIQLMDLQFIIRYE